MEKRKEDGDTFMKITNKEVYNNINTLSSKIEEFISSQKVINQATKDILETHDLDLDKKSKTISKVIYYGISGFVLIVGWLMLLILK